MDNLESGPEDRNTAIAAGALLGVLVNVLAVLFCHWL
jgi:hypothetical protein